MGGATGGVMAVGGKGMGWGEGGGGEREGGGVGGTVQQEGVGGGKEGMKRGWEGSMEQGVSGVVVSELENRKGLSQEVDVGSTTEVSRAATNVTEVQVEGEAGNRRIASSEAAGFASSSVPKPRMAFTTTTSTMEWSKTSQVMQLNRNVFSIEPESLE